MRTPDFNPPARSRKDNQPQIRVYNVITPLFGGGVIPRETDPVTPIRGTEIRGHLRFWWRATQGGRFDGDVKQMKAAEDALWGAAATVDGPGPSRVQVMVKTLDQGNPFIVRNRGQTVSISHYRSPYSYGAFPLEQDQTVREGIKFELALEYPKKNHAEIEAALWAWETFGGIGARTRRGFGALDCVRIDGKRPAKPASSDIKSYIEAGLNRHINGEKWTIDLPHLTKSSLFKLTPPEDDALASLRRLLAALKRFRQTRNPGQGQNRPGRSQWPEPDAIRRLTGQRSQRHQQSLSNIDKFPRAAFGLPIVFQFINERAGDPRQTSLQGRDFDRLASPLILRPILCADNRAVGVALVLETPHHPPGGLILKGARGNPAVRSDLTPAEANQIEPLQGQTDVLQAFLDTL